MTEEYLTADEMEDRVWAILAAATENRPEDIDELLVTLPWPDLVEIVFFVAQLGVALLTRGADPRDQDARAKVATQLRALLVERLAARERPGDA
ncbi:hypothetical protein [Streptomyces sp. NPDC002547]